MNFAEPISNVLNKQRISHIVNYGRKSISNRVNINPEYKGDKRKRGGKNGTGQIGRNRKQSIGLKRSPYPSRIKNDLN